MFSSIILETRKRLSILATHMDKLLTFSHVRSLKRTAEKNWANIFTEPIFKIFFIATTAKSVHISDGQLGPCGTD